MPRNRRHVAHDEEQRAIAASAKEGVNGARRVVGGDPLESVRVVVAAVERLILAVNGVQIDDQALEAAMERIVEQVPFDGPVAVPFVPLGDFACPYRKLYPAGIKLRIGRCSASWGICSN